jgi:hypothetical protein
MRNFIKIEGFDFDTNIVNLVTKDEFLALHKGLNINLQNAWKILVKKDVEFRSNSEKCTKVE